MAFIVLASILVLSFFQYSVQRRKVKRHNRRVDNEERMEQLIESLRAKKNTADNGDEEAPIR